MSEKNVLSAFSDYVKNIFDVDGDGIISFKEIFMSLSGLAVPIALFVVDVLVAVAEYRVWDVGMAITNDPYKATGFVLVSALPFYLGQLLWLYVRANKWQQLISIVMVIGSLVTSARFGLADLSQSYDVVAIIKQVIYLTAAYIILLLLFVLSDDGIRARRMKVRVRANSDQQKEFNRIIRDVLADLRVTKAEEDKIRQQFGDAAVNSIHKQLGKKKRQENGQHNGQQSRVFAADEKGNPTDRQQ